MAIGALAAIVRLFAFFAALPSALLEWCHGVLLAAAGHVGKGVARCLRTGLSLLAGDEAELAFVSYLPDAAAGLGATYATAFHQTSPWTALALLDLTALFSVWRRHRQAHAEAAAAAAVRKAAADPGNRATSACGAAAAHRQLPQLRCAAVHAKAAYGVLAAEGHVSSAAGFLAVVTVHQATKRAPRRIPPSHHLAAVQRLTGCPPGDVLAAQWQAHLHRPAYYVALDRARRCVVVSIRGTLQLGDFATVLDAVPQPVRLAGLAGHCHGGFLAAARSLLPGVAAALEGAAAAAPGWPVLLTGHSLGGGVAAVLTVLLLEGSNEPEWRRRLGEVHCIGVGAAAAFSRELGMACRQHVTSVLYGADCLPMFSVLGARLLIAEVHSQSWAAALAAALLRRLLPGSAAATARAESRSTCEAACGGGGCRGLCAAAAAEAPEIEAAAAAAEGAPRGGAHRAARRGGSSAWSSASTASCAAFAADYSQGEAGQAGTALDTGAGLVPMFPAGRILWLLPPGGRSQQRRGTAAAAPGLQLYETDQTSFQRFLVTLETAAHHLPDAYISALDSLAG